MKLRNFLYQVAILLSLLLVVASCQPKVDPLEEARLLLAVDIEFSRHSEQIGGAKAFLDYIDDSAVLLRANHFPVVGRDNISKLFASRDEDFTLTWEPLYALVSESGDLGYTYGIYKNEINTPNGEPVINEGTYVTIWKKDSGGNWKFVLDAGNPGLGQKKPNLE